MEVPMTGFTARSRAMLVALVLGTGAAWPLAAQAQVSLDVTIGTPPPAARVEVVPAPRHGYVWAPGFWSWDGHHHVWHEGYWEREHPGERFVPAAWVNGPHGWHFAPAHWERHEEIREERRECERHGRC
jgi:hypothetical protein